jgi:glycosyltransferase involved in cell wall biosynthesis
VHLDRLIRFLRRELGDTIELVCRPDAALDRWCAGIEAAGVRVHRVELTRPSGYWRLLRILRGARLVHLHLAHPVGKYQVVAAVAARALGRPTIATHHLALEEHEIGLGPRQRAAWMRVFGLYRRLIDRHIAISSYGKGVLTRGYRFDPARVSVIYNGTDVDRFRPADAPERALQRGRLLGGLTGSPPADTPLVCTVARLSPQKGLTDLIEAARSLANDLPSVRYVVLGEGESRATLTAAVSAAGLDRVLTLAGSRPPEEVADWLQSADLFVLPTHFEGGPAMALMEAMASGCAVIATRVGGSDELIPDAQTGCLVPARQPATLAAAIKELLRDAERRSRLGARARARVALAFDIRHSHALTLDLYRVVAGGLL